MIKSKGYAAENPSSGLKPFDFERYEPGPHEIQIEILYCGVCHTDLHYIKNEWKKH